MYLLITELILGKDRLVLLPHSRNAKICNDTLSRNIYVQRMVSILCCFCPDLLRSQPDVDMLHLPQTICQSVRAVGVLVGSVILKIYINFHLFMKKIQITVERQ